MKWSVALLLGGVAVLACAPDEVVVWSMPSGSSAAGTVATSGAGGSGGSGGETAGSGGFAGTGGEAAKVGGSGGSPSAGMGGSGGAPPNGGSAGAGGVVISDCTSNDDCPVSWVCAKPDCDAAGGICEPRPVFCPPEPMPVCGCDHVTYWNDCVRRQSGALAATEGECRSNAMPCDTGADCGVANASCARFVPKDAPCDESAPGVCWVAPAVCEPSQDPLRWKQCGNGAPDPAPCIDTCEAILSECPIRPLHHDDVCP